ncbi:MAG TPA: hypothetical protein PKE17_18790, partial [Saprospiraceae bacterium]|nr:hypothetical protein [Saprospiraceae bacterium]
QHLCTRNIACIAPMWVLQSYPLFAINSMGCKIFYGMLRHMQIWLGGLIPFAKSGSRFCKALKNKTLETNKYVISN